MKHDLIVAFTSAGVSNFGAFAFAICPPGSAASDDQVKDFVGKAVAGRVLTIREIAVLKGLVFESQTSLVAQLRADNDPDPSSRKLPAGERQARIESQRTRLVGLNPAGPLEVAHSVYDMFAGMSESDRLRYVPANKCISRTQEVMLQKPAKELKLDQAAGAIAVRNAAVAAECSTSTELETLQALTRRSLAMDLVGLMDYSVAQKWSQTSSPSCNSKLRQALQRSVSFSC